MLLDVIHFMSHRVSVTRGGGGGGGGTGDVQRSKTSVQRRRLTLPHRHRFIGSRRSLRYEKKTFTQSNSDSFPPLVGNRCRTISSEAIQDFRSLCDQLFGCFFFLNCRWFQRRLPWEN